MAKVIASTTTNSPSVVKTDRPGYLVDSSKSVIGRPVGSFSNIVGTDRIIKEASNIERVRLRLASNDCYWSFQHTMTGWQWPTS